MQKNNEGILTGKLFVFEGPDGVGKSTLVEYVCRALKTDGVQVLTLSFPGRSRGSLGELVYRLHHDSGQFCIDKINKSSLQVLHVAAHIDCIERVILPALKRGMTVVLDRFWWSTVVYGTATGVPKEILDALVRLEEVAWGGRKPDMAFLVSRDKPFREELSLKKWEVVCDQYKNLFDTQKDIHPAEIIENNSSIENISNRIYEKMIGSSKQHSFDYGDIPKYINDRKTSYLNLTRNVTWLPTKTTEVFDTYWRFAAERQDIFFRRVENTIGPFTNDPILRIHKFTNAYRASDRVSQYLIKNVIYNGDQDPKEVFFRTILFKFFNKIETWEKLTNKIGDICYKDFNFKMYDEVLTKEKMVNSIYSAAYIMSSSGKNMPFNVKHRNHLKLIERMMAEDLPLKICDAKSLQQVFYLLREYPMIGDFLAFQYAIDLNYSAMINFSEMSFVVPGPGAKDGMRKCFLDYGGRSEVDLIKCMADRQEQEFERLGLSFKSLWGRPLQLIDCQNLFCEVDKYARIAHPDVCGLTGRKKIKQKFRPIYKPIEYFFPPKWNINEAVKKSIKISKKV
ncbi:MAG: nucleotide kinase domain-containing protein [Pedobacter sp.]